MLINLFHFVLQSTEFLRKHWHFAQPPGQQADWLKIRIIFIFEKMRIIFAIVSRISANVCTKLHLASTVRGPERPHSVLGPLNVCLYSLACYDVLCTSSRLLILSQWQYPPQARRMLMEGRLMLVFHLDKQGRLKGIDIERSSGHGLLDEEAIRAVSEASPFPPFPSHIDVKRLNIKAAFDYRLKSKR